MINLLGVGGSCVVIKENQVINKIIPNCDKYLSLLKNAMRIKNSIKNNIGERINDYFVFPNSYEYVKRDENIDNIILKNNRNVRYIDFEDYLKVNLPNFGESLDMFDYFVTYKKNMKSNELYYILLDFWDSLEILHENEVIHNDIKLENILLSNDDNWRARIIDFDFSFDFKEIENVNYVGTYSLINETTGFFQKTLKLSDYFFRFFKCFKKDFNDFSFSINLLKIQNNLIELYRKDKESFYRYNDIFNGIILSLFIIKINNKNSKKNSNIDKKFIDNFLDMVNIDENLKFKEIYEIKNYLKKMII